MAGIQINGNKKWMYQPVSVETRQLSKNICGTLKHNDFNQWAVSGVKMQGFMCMPNEMNHIAQSWIRIPH